MPAAAIWSTNRLASSSTRTFIARMAFGRNQSAPIARTTRCCGSSMWIRVLIPTRGLLLVGLRRHQHRPRRIGEQRVGPLDRHDVGVLGDRPERAGNPAHRPRTPGRWPADASAPHAAAPRRCRPCGSASTVAADHRIVNLRIRLLPERWGSLDRDQPKAACARSS